MHAQKLDMGKERVDLRIKLDWSSEKRGLIQTCSTDAAILIPDWIARRWVHCVSMGVLTNLNRDIYSTFLSLSCAGVQLYSTKVFSFRPSMWTSSTMKSFSGASLRVLQSYVDGNSRRGRYHGEREEG